MDTPIRRYWNLLVVYLKPQWQKTVLLAVLLVSSIGLQLLNPQILRGFIDAVKAGALPGDLLVTALLFLGVSLANQLITISATYVGADVGWRATNMIRVDLARHCLGLDMSFHNEHTPGELIERIDGDVMALSNFFSQFVVKIIGSMLMIGGVLVLLYMEDWRLGAGLTAYALLAMVALNKAKDVAVQATGEEREASAMLYGYVEERLAGIDDIRANGGGSYTMRMFGTVAAVLFAKGRRAWIRRSMLWVVVVGLFTIGDMISLGFGIWLFGLGAITLGTVYLFFQYTQLMWGFVEELTHQLQDLQKAGASIGRVEALLRTRNTMHDGIGTPIPGGPLSVEFDGLTFRYDDNTILKELNFALRPGTVLGLLGRTGSGKTTLTRLLFRLYDPAAGAVRLSGVDLREAHLSQLRQRVAMVTQEVQLFHASVRDNLTFFDRSVDDTTILRVIDTLGLAGWFAKFPEGLDTMLGTGGSGISAGEGQLLAFVRVFLRNPGLVILDEPSSRMDLATERLLEQAMATLLKGRTAIIIAHRLSTVARADEIMILESGEIREHAERARLAENPDSRFSELLRTGLEQLAA